MLSWGRGGYRTLNESPSEKEGKSWQVKGFPAPCYISLNESPSEKEGKFFSGCLGMRCP